MGSPLIEVIGVSKAYREGNQIVPALREISANFEEGEFVLWTGPSGCGKSTLLNLIGGLDLPDDGEIRLFGRSSSGFTESDWTRIRRTRLGIVFQFFNLLPTITIFENIVLPLVLNRVPAGEINRRGKDIMLRLGLDGKQKVLPRELSGGEQQRVAIARALIHSPGVLLADEPTGNLDSKNGKEILTLMASLAKEIGMLVVMATHSLEAISFSSRVIRMRDGRIDV